MRRRQLLTATAVGMAALAGCTGNGDDENGNEELEPGEASVEVVEEFYAAYNDADLDTVNELSTQGYTEQFGDIEEEDFEEFGGIENMSWTIEETTVERESEEMVEVHADVTVATPIGEGDDVDYFLVVPEDGEWQYAMFLPEVVREDMSQEEIDQAMRR